MIETFTNLISKSNQVLITTHKSPDGDAVGSSVACYEFLKACGKNPLVLFPDSPPDNLMPFLTGADYLFYKDDFDCSIYDLVFCLDFNHAYRVGDQMSIIFNDLNCPKIMIDHHPNPSSFCDLTISRPDNCSTAQMFYELIEESKMLSKLTIKACESIYLGIMTDTGSFRYPSVTAKTHEVLSNVISKGVIPHQIHEKIFDQNSSDQLKLRGFAVSDKMHLIEGSPIGIMELSQDELKRFHHKKGDTEGLVNVILSIKGVSIAIFMMENEEGNIKMSFRSKGPYYVNEFAQRYFNGGGHKYAAGGISESSLSKTRDFLLCHYKELL